MFGWMRTVAVRIRGVVATRAVDEDFTQELDAHLAMLTEENMSREAWRRKKRDALHGCGLAARRNFAKRIASNGDCR